MVFMTISCLLMSPDPDAYAARPAARTRSRVRRYQRRLKSVVPRTQHVELREIRARCREAPEPKLGGQNSLEHQRNFGGIELRGAVGRAEPAVAEPRARIGRRDLAGGPGRERGRGGELRQPFGRGARMRFSWFPRSTF